ncbi:MAG TPA: translocation/assembly module TamB domain-containing protein, partial [Flavipsychrobacter sp.]|nr:translocation/assembly module TamB domain-containing protein [Flavipsychrobacter sp.]
ERFALAATMHKNGDTQIVRLQPDLKLNYQTWQVQEPNSIALSDKGFYVSNFNISNNNQYIKINSDQPHPNAPLKVDISNFLLANITQVISRDTLLANGLLGGNIVLEHINPSPVINSKLQIKDLSVMNDTIGDIAIEVNNKQDNALGTKVNIQGRGNDVSLTGTYYLQTTNGNDFNFDLNMKALNVQSVEGLTFGSIRNSSGFLRGEIYLKGTTSNPQISGEVRTDQVATTVSMLNAYFKMPADKIIFTNSGLQLDNFEILDSAGNKAVLNGQVNTTDLSNIGLDLNIRAKDWRAIHSTVTDNKTFYGDLLLSTNLNVKGTPSSPNVDGTLDILKGTKLTVVMPEQNPEIQSHKGIVKFYDSRDSDRMAFIPPRKKRDSTKIKLATGSNINVNIGIDKQAEFSLIMDQATGDFLTVRGDAALNANVTPNGDMGLTGTYSLHEGTYQLNYNFIKRKFKIQDGSSITFAGDPIKSQADITAVYEANVAPYDLVQNEVADQSQLVYYKQRLPFNVELHLNGPVMTPRITFNVVLPDDKLYPISYDAVELVQGKLNQVRQDTSELNKQVFALLILGHFVGEDPFSSGAGTSASTAALQSVSTFIGEQLNQFASNLVKGVDLSVDLATSDDYTTGDLRQRTDLNVAASKRLLNDRLKITVGNDFELQGPQTSNSDQSNLVPSNLAADYNLSPDGRYVVRAYRKNYDEGVLEGYVTETGVNFIVSLDYNHFKNVFKKKNVKKPMPKDESH